MLVTIFLICFIRDEGLYACLAKTIGCRISRFEGVLGLVEGKGGRVTGGTVMEIFPGKIIQLRKEKKSIAMFCVESDYEPDRDPAEPDLVPPLTPALPPQALTEKDPEIYRIFSLSTERLSRSTLHLKQGGKGSLYSCTL